MRRLRLFTPALLSLSAGAMYLLAKEDLKRKEEGKANIADAVKNHGTDLVTNDEKREAMLKLLKLEANNALETASKKLDEIRNLIDDEFKSLEEDSCEDSCECFDNKKD